MTLQNDFSNKYSHDEQESAQVLQNTVLWIVSTKAQCCHVQACGYECRFAAAVGNVSGRHIKLLLQGDTYPVDLEVLTAIENAASQVDIEDQLPALPVTNAQELWQKPADGQDKAQAPSQSEQQENAEANQVPAPNSTLAPVELSQDMALTSAPAVDIDEARRFLGLIARNETTFTFQTFDDNKARRAENKERLGHDPLARVLHGTFDSHCDALVAQNKKGAGIFVMVNMGDGHGRKKINVVRVRAVCADLDGTPLESTSSFCKELKPSAIVESSPGKFQIWWLCENLALEQFQGVQFGIAARLNSDPNIVGLPLVLRLPGFLHQKGEPFLSRILYPNPGIAPCQPYSAEEILSTFPPVEKRVEFKKISGKAPISIGLDSEQVTDEIVEDLRSALTVIPANDYGEWSAMAFRLKSMSERGRVLFHEWSAKCAEKYTPEACDEMFDRAEPTRTSYKAIFSEAQATGWVNPRRGTSASPWTGSVPQIDIGAAMQRLDTDPGALFEPGALEELRRLRSTDPARFARLRAQAKAAKNISMSEFDRLSKPTDDGTAEAAGITFREIEPCADAVDGAALLEELANLYTAHVKLPKHADVVIALWTLLTYLADVADVLPMLVLSSPEKGCGKTTLLALLDKLVWRPLPAASITPAALFRVIEQAQPTLLIDEVDSFLKSNEEMRGLLDSGHTRAAAFVLRTVEINKKWEVRRFSTFGPKVLSGIGRMPGTIEDRSLVVTLQRKRAGEKVKRLRHKDQFDDVRGRCLRWALDHKDAIFETEQELPEFLQNRTGDNWSPLFSIAAAVGEGWPELAIEAVKEFAGADQAADSGVGVDLLRDIRAGFEDLSRPLPEKVSTKALIDRLIGIDDGRWCDYARGKAITPRQLAVLLKRFLIMPKTIRLDGGTTIKGYTRDQFDDAFARYLPSHAVTS